MTAPLPIISIVVPNFNSGATLGRTLQSLVDQNYPGLEIIVVDGGSTDQSVDVIKRYAPHLKWWVSEKDAGQADAINKGFQQCTGEVVNWLCSSDTLEPEALHTIGRCFAETPEVDVVVGSCRMVFIADGMREGIWRVAEKSIPLMTCSNPIPQSSCFFRRALIVRDPPIDVSYHYAMDLELWNYLRSRNARWRCISDLLSTYPMGDNNKTTTGGIKIAREFDRIHRAYTNALIPLSFWYMQFCFPVQGWMHSPRPALVRFLTRIYFKLYRLVLTPLYGHDQIRAMNWTWIYNLTERRDKSTAKM